MNRILAVMLLSLGVTSSLLGQEIGGTVTESKLDEISGCAVSKQNPGILWLHNDGDDGSIYAIRYTGETVARLELPVDVVDIEDIALGPKRGSPSDYLYVGDIGDNDRERDSVQIICFPEPQVTARRPEQLDAPRTIHISYLELFTLQYPDGAHDAEALLLNSEDHAIWIVTKQDVGAQLFGVSLNPMQHTSHRRLQRIAHLAVSRVSAGDISRDGRMVLLRREERGWLWQKTSSNSLIDAMQQSPQRVPVRAASQAANGEAVGFTPNGKAYCTVSEGERQKIAVFRLADDSESP